MTPAPTMSTFITSSQDRLCGGYSPGEQLEVVPASADCVAERPEDPENGTDYDDDDADRPENGDPGDEADNEEKNAENNHRGLLAVYSRRPGRAPGNIRM